MAVRTKYLGLFLAKKSEFIYCTLNDSLIPNEEYLLEFYTKPATFSKYGIKKITLALIDSLVVSGNSE